MIKFKKTAFTLLEMIIAVGIFALVMATVAGVFNRMVYIYQNVVDKAECSQQAANALEWLTRDIQSSPCLYEANATSIALMSEQSECVHYFLQGATLIRAFGCNAGAQNYTLAEGISNFDLNYYNTTNQIVSNPEYNPHQIKAVELNIAATKRTQRFSLNTVARFTNSSGCPWAKTYGSSSWAVDPSWALAGQQTDDTGYAILADGAILMKTDTWGNLDSTWSTNPKELPWQLGSAYSFIQISGGYIFTGNRDIFPNEYQVTLMQTDDLGEQVWLKIFGGSNNEGGWAVQQTSPDNGYIIAGDTRSGFPPNYDIYLIKTDANGYLDPSWPTNPRVYPGAGNESGLAVRQARDGGYIIGGSDFLMKLLANGDLDTSWPTNPKGVGGATIVSVQQTADEGYIAVGVTGAGNTTYVIKTDANGDLSTSWSTNPQTFGGFDYGLPRRSVQQTSPDDGYFIVGSANSRGYARKLLSNGNLDPSWPENPKILGDNYTWCYDGQQTSDGGYFVVCHTEGFGAGWHDDVFLVKTDSRGNCPQASNPKHIPPP